MNEREIFLQACEIEEDLLRSRFLNDACAGSFQLCQRLQRQIKARTILGDFLEIPAFDQLANAKCGITQNHVAASIDSKSPAGVSTRIGIESTSGWSRKSEDVPLTFLEKSSETGSLGRLGSYEVLEVVGTGAFGIVLRASDRTLNRQVAVKVLLPQIAATSPARKRFLREARAAAAVRHDNVVHIYAVHERPNPHLTMEFVVGKTIQQSIKDDGPMNPIDIVRLGRQIASGLQAAHDIGLIHRDIKPSNLLLEGESVKITDFGLARSVDDASLTQTGLIVGTPMYMSPEQALGASIDHRTDLFSLGSVLYFMATGCPPFLASTTVGVLKQVAEVEPRQIQKIRSSVPDWLCEIISRLHEKKPENRYSTANEVAEIFNHCLLSHERGSVPELPTHNQNRNRRWVYYRQGVSIVLLTFFVIFCFLFANRNQKRQLDDRHLSTTSKQEIQIKPVVGLPIELGEQYSPRKIADGRVDDISYNDEILSLDATSRSPNIWIDFTEIEAGALTIQARVRVLNPDSNGRLRLVFMQHSGRQVYGIIQCHEGRRCARICEHLNYTEARTLETEITSVDWNEWFDLKFAVTRDHFTLLVDNEIVAILERNEVYTGFVSLSCLEWKCELQHPQVIIGVLSESTSQPNR